MNLRTFVIVDKDGIPQGMDDNSGGYLYSTDFPGEIRHWSKLEVAEQYCKIFNNDSPSDRGYRVVQCNTHIFSSV